MQKMEIKNNLVLYYGNMAGYVEDGKAVIDPMFQNDDLSAFLKDKKGLEIQWRGGVFDRLAAGSRPDPETGEQQRLRDCRIWQLKPEADLMIRFIGYDELKKTGAEPDPANYRTVFDGQIETNDLEEIYTKFNINHPPNFEGHSLSISDVVELYDNGGSQFHYVDRFGFTEIDFESQQEQRQGQNHNQNQSMNL